MITKAFLQWASRAVGSRLAQHLPHGDRYFTPEQRRELYRKSGGFCGKCRCALDGVWHADHIIPYSAGGETVLSNGQALCARCNGRKHATVPNDRFGPFPVYLDEETLVALLRFVCRSNAQHPGWHGISTAISTLLYFGIDPDGRPAAFDDILDMDGFSSDRELRFNISMDRQLGIMLHELTVGRVYERARRRLSPLPFRDILSRVIEEALATSLGWCPPIGDDWCSPGPSAETAP